MSSLKNAVKRREHRERSQPEARKRLGLLEKKKDYKKRAEDFQRKRKTIQHLQGKADERNPDEFYFAMENTSTRDGVHVARSTIANKYSQAELALMKTQDSGYLQLKATAEASKVNRLQSTLHLLGEASASQHKVFEHENSGVQSGGEVDACTTPPCSGNAPDTGSEGLKAKLSRQVQAQYRELQQRIERCQALKRAAQAVNMQRLVAGKGSKQKITVRNQKGEKHTVWRWRSVRKK